MRHSWIAFVIGCWLFLQACQENTPSQVPVVEIAPTSEDSLLSLIRLPEGFQIAVYAEVENARSMSYSPNGTLFVGNRSKDKVYAVRDTNQDFRADVVHVLDTGLNMPCGVAFRDGALYVAEVSRILRYDSIESRLDDPPSPVVVYDRFPTDRHHGWKFIRFGPDGLLYVPVGAPCNICNKEEENPIYATIARIDVRADQPTYEIFARGVRNSVGFDWHPLTNELWFTNNGRDHLGDDIPPDELNHAPTIGLHFGYPFCHGGTIADPEFGDLKPCTDFVPPAQPLGAHVAALGMRFYTGAMFPEGYRNQILIAEHGSWNRSSKVGYRLSLVRLNANQSVGYETFAEGWLQGEEPWGRPADIEQLPDGSLLVSDDFAGKIYRISYQKR
ncbi:MAG: PQQ-dependent sugar dehydrogenase [Bernardetiaceae bacterium]